MIYVESSAFLKLLRTEAESAALRQFLAALEVGELVSSSLLLTEAHRAASRLDGVTHDDVDALLETIDLLQLLDEICLAAGRLAEGHPIRSLDALHVATAQLVEATTMVTYDARQIQAARLVGLATVSPS